MFCNCFAHISHFLWEVFQSKRCGFCAWNVFHISLKTATPQRFEAISLRDSLDWKEIPASEITQRVTGKVQAGSIVLFHNAAKHTPEALPGILEASRVTPLCPSLS